jgi:hypothetical protein
MKQAILYIVILSLSMLGCKKNPDIHNILKNEKMAYKVDTVDTLPRLISSTGEYLPLLGNLNGKMDIKVEIAGTLPTLIPITKKYLITDLTLSGNLNGTDIKYIREMAGRDSLLQDTREPKTKGKLTKLNLKDVNIVPGGKYYYGKHCTEYNKISEEMFLGLDNLTSIILPNNISHIGWCAFDDCTGITSITIPNSVTFIDGMAFVGCEGLTSVYLGNNIAYVEDLFFAYCKKLKEVHIKSTISPNIGEGNFNFRKAAKCKLYVPKRYSTIYKSAKGWNEFSEIIEE